MAIKTRRLETRVDPDTKELISEAARLNRESVSAFMVRAARGEADRVLARANATLIPVAQFDALLQSLDEPDTAPTLTRAAESRRRATRT